MSNPWKNAGSVADLGNLMADWLQGRIRTWPGYMDTKTVIPARSTWLRIQADGRACTSFGWSPGHRTLVDPEWGRDTQLWPALTRAVGR
jgi:hypothetical protein